MRQKRLASPLLRLVCFPYAGAGASVYRGWHDLMPEGVEVLAVQLPGRETRILEPPIETLEALLDAVDGAVSPYCDVPFAFFGHSMGAVVAFELARRRVARGAGEPLHLFVSGHRAPNLPPTNPPTYDLPREGFLAELRRMEGTPPEVLEHEELMEILLPALRADFRIIETYQLVPGPMLSCPVSALAGESDHDAPPETISDWAQFTSGAFSLAEYPGGHFFITSARDRVTAATATTLAPLLAPPS